MTALFVWVEHDGTAPRKGSLEALGKAKALGGEAVAVVFGQGAEAVGGAVAPFADRVLVCADGGLWPYRADIYARALADLALAQDASAVLMAATFAGRELAPRLATRLGAAFLADCTDLSIDDGKLVGRRALYGGKAYGLVRSRTKIAVATTRPNAFLAPAPGGGGSVDNVTVSPDESAATVREVNLSPSEMPELTEAEVVVAGGRGLGTAEGFALVEDLARALGGAVGASRAVVDAGLRSHDEQVGKSGKTIAPKLYVALGISGAIHHVMGMDTAKVVVAVNKDPAAPIFKSADFGIVGDALELAPALAERVRALSK